MKRGGPLKRGKPMKRGAALRRGRRLNPVSEKRKSEAQLRREVVQAAIDRDRECVAKGRVPGVPCWGPLVGDEYVSRARWPGGHLELDNVQAMCVRHNGWKEDHPDDAIELDLAAHSWER